MDNVISSAKTDMFRIRMNPEIREELEQIYAKTGLTLTDAINVFFQQSLSLFYVSIKNWKLIMIQKISVNLMEKC